MASRLRLRRGDRVVLATHNAGKIREFEAMLRPFGLQVETAAALGLAEPDETGGSFAENAMLKARAAAEAAAFAAIADDSGLAVDALSGAPGIRSARWAGAERDFAAAMRRVRDGIGDTPPPWAARFLCVLALAAPDGRGSVHCGEVAGDLVWPPRGDAGFGYDPMFRPAGSALTFAEMPTAEKDRMSHRARAFERFRRDVLAA